MRFSWTFVSQLRLKFVFCKRIWSNEAFLISTQWILSWQDNHRLIMKWWLSSKDIILSILIKSFDILSLTRFLRYAALLACNSYWPLLSDTAEIWRVLIRTFLYPIHNANCDSVKGCKNVLINIFSFVFLLDYHQLIIDWFLSVKTWNWVLIKDPCSLLFIMVMVHVIVSLN